MALLPFNCLLCAHLPLDAIVFNVVALYFLGHSIFSQIISKCDCIAVVIYTLDVDTIFILLLSALSIVYDNCFMLI